MFETLVIKLSYQSVSLVLKNKTTSSHFVILIAKIENVSSSQSFKALDVKCKSENN